MIPSWRRGVRFQLFSLILILTLPPLLVFILLQLGAIKNEILQLETTAVKIYLGTVVLSVFIATYSVGRYITTSLRKLEQGARHIADGDTGFRIQISGPSEMRRLSQEINRIAETAQSRTEALSDNEKRYRFLFNFNPLPMWAWNADTLEIIAVNEAVLARYGYNRDQLLGKPVTTLLDPEEHIRFAQRRLPFTEERQQAGIWKHRTASGEVVEMEVITTSSRRLGEANWLSTGIDIIARRKAERALALSEEQLRQAQKMEAVGAFASGIAHDFNNLLTGITGFCELALDEIEPDHKVKPDLVEVRNLAERGADLTRRILAASRHRVLNTTVMDLNSTVQELERLIVRLVGEHINVTTSYDQNVSHVNADGSQLEHILLNLVANARDAMPRNGTLSIETQKLTPDQAADYGLNYSEWAMIAIHDTGSGMSEEVRQRVFEPFFTTKERGKGTGLGLALAHSVMEQAGGKILCESSLGIGSTFRLFFPEVTVKTELEDTESDTFSATLLGTETILLAEDEDSVRTVTQAALEKAGYTVLTAADGPSALEIGSNYQNTIHLLLTDVVMPGMHGRELAQKLILIKPDLRVLFASGYTDDPVLLRGISTDELFFMHKPYTPQSMLKRVRKVLDSQLSTGWNTPGLDSIL